MSTYAIGDIQGCFDSLQQLLDKIQFASTDRLWFTGDLVNRGPQSLEVLRFIKSLGPNHKVVLGNHDLHLLSVAYGLKSKKPGDTLDSILEAEDVLELMGWLRHQPLLHYDSSLNYLMVHAGLSPLWDINKARSLAKEVEQELQNEDYAFLLENMYGNDPDHWEDHLSGISRWRCIINYLTRVRFCDAEGRIEMEYKGKIKDKPKDLIPWYDLPNRQTRDQNIVFGHWASLEGQVDTPNLFPLDTGCVWGRSLTAMRLEDQERISMPCPPLAKSSF